MRLSIVIPTLNESTQLTSVIAGLQRQLSQQAAIEIIVVDGGSIDNTRHIAQQLGIQVLYSPRQQRAYQLNLGAAKAQGDVLYFLHADTFPPNDFYQSIQHAIEQGAQAGCFRLSFDWNHWFLRLHAWFTRYNWDGFHYGDQSLFVRQDYFEEVGGFDESLDIMEDYQMVKTLKRNYSFVILPEAVITSARRYREIGVYRLQIMYYLIFCMFRLGFSQTQLWEVYRYCFQETKKNPATQSRVRD